MTKKDYTMVAKMLSRLNNKDNFTAIINNLCKELIKNSPLFNKSKFIKACHK